MEEKKEKKGFWASLFAPKPCTCSCGTQIVEEFDKSTGAAPNESDSSTPEEPGKTDDSPQHRR